MNASSRLSVLLTALVLGFSALPHPDAAADELGPTEVQLFKGTLLDRKTLHHPAGATFVAASDQRASKLFVPANRATSPRLVWRHDLTLLRVYGQSTRVNLKIAGEWYTFTSEGKALREYDLEALGALDELERIQVEIAGRAASRTGDRQESYREYARPRARLDLRFYWQRRFGKKSKRPSAPSTAPGGAQGGNNAGSGSSGLKMVPGYKIIHPKMKMVPGYKIVQPKMKMVPGYKIIQPKMKMVPGYKIVQPKMKMVPGYKMAQPKMKMVPGYKIAQPKMKMVPGYKIIQPKQGKQKVARAAPMGKRFIPGRFGK